MANMIPAWVDGKLKPVDKLQAHIEGLKHKAVSIFIIQGQSILLQRRALCKYHTPGLWANTCCTHPDWGEESMACAVRRLNEELGITSLPLEFRQHIEYHADVGNGLIENEAVDVFLANVDAAPAITENPQEVMETRWISYRDLLEEVALEPHKFTPWLKIYLHDHAQTILGHDLTTEPGS